jgi:hypothetical protein
MSLLSFLSNREAAGRKSKGHTEHVQLQTLKRRFPSTVFVQRAPGLTTTSFLAGDFTCEGPYAGCIASDTDGSTPPLALAYAKVRRWLIHVRACRTPSIAFDGHIPLFNVVSSSITAQHKRTFCAALSCRCPHGIVVSVFHAMPNMHRSAMLAATWNKIASQPASCLRCDSDGVLL